MILDSINTEIRKSVLVGSIIFTCINDVEHSFAFAVCELKNPSMNAFLSGLESSGWLKHIKAILDTSAFISKVR